LEQVALVTFYVGFDEVDETMFQGVEKQFKLIFCIQGIEKSDLDEVALVTF
jgi:hypothetical protein